jgi:hypothetical protein
MLVGSTPRRTNTCATLFIEAIGYLCWLLQSTANLNRYIVRLNVGDAVHEHKISGKIMVFSVQVIVSSNVRVNIGTKKSGTTLLALELKQNIKSLSEKSKIIWSQTQNESPFPKY